MRGILGAGLAAALVLVIASPAAALNSATCTYTGSNHRVNITQTGSVFSTLERDVAGHIIFNGAWCQGVATVTNTDLINVQGDPGDQTIYIQLGNGGFKPGFTDEPGSSDEIEFAVNLVSGTDDVLEFAGTDGVEHIDMGQDNSLPLVTGHINLNAGETTGIDFDVSVINVTRVTVLAQGGNDVIRGIGLAGSGPNHFGLPMWIYGGNGADVMKGGAAADRLQGDAGKDSSWGYEGPDVIYMADGKPGDTGRGGTGKDTVVKDAGDSWTQ